MTREEIERERAEVRRHPDGWGQLFADPYRQADMRTRDFMRRIAPYCFEEDGELLIELQPPQQMKETT